MQKPTAPRSGSPRVAEAITVVPSGDARAVPDGHTARPGEVDPTRSAALEAAQGPVRTRFGATRARITDHPVGDNFTLGRQAFEKISAVEGIRLSRAMKRDLMDAQANARSAEEARHILATKYGRRRP